MSIYNLPKKLHPDFLNKTRQIPISPVRKDSDSSLAKGLSQFYIAYQDGFYDAIDGAYYPSTTGAGVPKVGEKGRYLETPTGHSVDIGNNNKASGEEYSITWLAKKSASLGGGIAGMVCGDNGGSSNFVWMKSDTITGGIQTRRNGADLTLTLSPAVLGDVLIWRTITFKGSDVNYFCNKQSVSGTLTTGVHAINAITSGGVGTGYNFAGDFYGILFHDRALSQQEVESLHYDNGGPKQLLKPQNPLAFFKSDVVLPQVIPSNVQTSPITTAWNGTTFVKSIPYTVESGTDLLAVTLIGDITQPASITFDGSALTHELRATDGNNKAVYFYYLTSPTAGSGSIEVSSSGAREYYLEARSLAGVDTTTPVRATNQSSGYVSTYSSNMTTVVGDLVLDGICTLSSISHTVGDGQTVVIDNQIHGGFTVSSSFSVADSTSTVMEWTSSSSDFSVEAAIVFAVAGSGVSGSLSETLEDVASSASGTVSSSSVSGSLSETLEDVAQSGAGTITNSGSLSETLEDVAQSGAGTITNSGSLSETLEDFSSTSNGVIGNIISGYVATTLDDFSVVMSGEVPYSGSVSEVLDDVNLAGSGTITVVATSSSSLDDMQGVSSGIVTVQGSAVSSLEDTTSASNALAVISGTVSEQLEYVVSVASGDVDLSVSGTLSGTLDDYTSSATGTTAVPTTLTAQDIENIVDAIFARVVEGTETFQQQLMLIRAEAAGKLLVAGNTITIRDAADTKDRITATVDNNGQRTSVDTDVS